MEQGKHFQKLGERLGFWDFISASVEDRGRKKKDLLEDCVEAVVGAIELLVDDNYRPGVGNAVAYEILCSVFNEITISLKYEDLYDAKTRLKELFDYNKDKLGKLSYEKTRDEESGLFTSRAVIGSSICMSSDLVGVVGYGTATKLKDAEQKAAIHALAHLNRHGYSKPIPPEYRQFHEA